MAQCFVLSGSILLVKPSTVELKGMRWEPGPGWVELSKARRQDSPEAMTSGRLLQARKQQMVVVTRSGPLSIRISRCRGDNEERKTSSAVRDRVAIAGLGSSRARQAQRAGAERES